MTTATTTPVRTFAEAEAVLAQNLPRYEERPQQQALAAAIEEQFFGAGIEPHQMFAQGPTGVGKSLAYLIPAVLSGKRVVVSVTTKALQDQLAGLDLPFLEQNLMPFTWAVLKGRSSYLCLNRALAVPDGEVANLAQVLAWVKENPTFSGLREDIPVPVTDIEWSKVCSESEECAALDCKKAGGCYASLAREKAQGARIVVVNHSLYFTDLAVRVASEGAASMIGPHDFAVFDEAHEVAEIASNALSTQTSMGSFTSTTSQVRAWVARYGREDDLEDITPRLMDLEAAATEFFRTAPVVPKGYGSLRWDISHLEMVFSAVENLIQAVDALGSAFVAVRAASGDPKVVQAQKSRLRSRLVNLRQWAIALVSTDPTEQVTWTETSPGKRGQTKVVVKSAPVHVGPYLAEHLWSATPALFMSATLAVKGSFRFQAEQLGVEEYASKIVDSPFDYPTISRLYVPLTVAAPTPANRQVWEAQVLDEVRSLIRAAGGRTLVLFTSMSQMRSAYGALKDLIEQPLRMQGEEGSSVRELSQWFIENEESVLFGSRSFMTGFDARGASCINVIITKMPFPVPDEPLTEARCERIEAGGGSAFMDYSVPVMSLVLQQAAGRLIRHGTDRGLVAILDPRLVSKYYGKQVVKDLPPMTLVTSRPDAEAFLAESVTHFEGR